MLTPLPPLGDGKSLTERLTSSLREAIVNGHFLSGEKLDFDLIAQEYGVSRTPVREAIGRLEADGFIELRPHHGAFIPTVTEQEILDVYEIRAILEAEIVRQVSLDISDEILDKLEKRQLEALTKTDKGYPTNFYQSDIHFHETLLTSVKNSLFKVVLDSLNNRISKVRNYAQLQPGPHMTEALNEHLDVIKAMKARDPNQAVKKMRKHLEKSGQRIRDLSNKGNEVHAPSLSAEPISNPGPIES